MQGENRQLGGDGQWRRYWRVLLAVAAAEIVIVTLFIAITNPYGNLPPVVFRTHVITDINQRYQYPEIVRSGRYDSILIGTSTSRLLRPAALEEVLGGRFANLAMNSGMAWEQYRLAQLFLHHASHPRTLVVALDHVWCDADADKQKTTQRGFPEWMFDDNPWNDALWMLNKRSLEIGGRRIGVALGVDKPRIPPDGYEVFTPPESEYDLVKARKHIYESDNPQPIPIVNVAAYQPSEAERASWTYPALDWLAKIVAPARGWKRIVLVFMPTHVITIQQQGSVDAARIDECKQRIARLASQSGGAVIDFRYPSPITTDDSNYWDRLHYRVGIAERIVADIGRALSEGRDDSAGDWRVLVPGAVSRSAEPTAAISPSTSKAQ